MTSNTTPEVGNKRAIARLIARHYGDGGVYLPRSGAGPETLMVAIANGFVSRDGFITRKGRQLLARTEF